MIALKTPMRGTGISCPVVVLLSYASLLHGIVACRNTDPQDNPQLLI